ncbi:MULTISPECIES: cytochrome c biogenesis protein ResB [Comamonas]|uniref:cytochrome c biogenesis protein ResB n=1 Tax=Comamonas TaxID=283 RepID=UPI00054EB119|nr:MULTISPECIES: cytochrome c biogenesis protein ResB [Comamonas]MCO8247612.1 cytochrome c biogenesis protein ResB [Comamonas thiooxydans]UBQ42587.1 cytochrome c biogenesis protein ResB [Comamonas thiooxydans]
MSDLPLRDRDSSRSQAVRATLELLASMRFAISLLTVICIASVIGTVLKQHEPLVNYVNQFGPFWAQLFLALKLNAVYSAWWFLLILAFLVISTSLCVSRHAPKYLADIRNYKENLREQSLKAFHHRAEADVAGSTEEAAKRIGQQLVSGGWKVKMQQRDTAAGPGTGWMLAAKAGAANKLGYIAAHCAIVLICIGGLFDGDLIVRAQMLLGGKTPYTGGGMISDVAPEHRLSIKNPTFRGNLMVSEGTQSGTAILNQSDGILLQDLPFSVELKKFIVEYYSTGMPKLFASDIVIHDRATGEKLEKRVEVNHPASYKGIEIYQSSFDDGGSSVKLHAVPMDGVSQPFDVEGVIGNSTEFVRKLADGQQDKVTLEYTALRTINVENFGGQDKGGAGTDVRKVDLKQAIDERLGAAHKTTDKKDLRNIGPSVGYKLRDASGQAREFQNYMLPVDTGEGQPVFLLGVRENQADQMRYLRVPADPEGTMNTFMQLRQAMQNKAQAEKAARAYVQRAVDVSKPELAEPLTQSALKALELFAGQDVKLKAPDGRQLGGLQAISDFMDSNVPEAERERAGEVLVRILNGVLFELAQQVRQQAGLKPFENDEKTQAFMTQSVFSLSDAQFYPAPVVFMLQDFKQVQASVFQVARAPGKNIVYLGCLFLIIGVFAMLYVRDRRIWIWLTPANDGSHANMALSTNRKTMDGDREFVMLADKLIGAKPLQKKTPGGSV